MRLLISGAGGFLGSALSRRLAVLPNSEVIGIYRRAPTSGDFLPGCAPLIGNLDANQDWSGLPRQSHVLVHAAARVHVMNDTAPDPLAEYRTTNVEGTLNLARQAAAAGLRRFIYISTLKVNGESTRDGSAFSADDAPAPLDAYAVSKWEAEQGLREMAARTGLEVVIIRPPLVYGPGVKGNFRSMMRWLRRGIPLPLAAIGNRRSLVNLDNLLDLIVTCIDHPAAANQTFLVSDGEDLSTPALLKRTAAALGTRARLVRAPIWLLRAGAAALGRPGAVRRLSESLCADISKNRRLLDWAPPASIDDGLKKTAAEFLHETRN